MATEIKRCTCKNSYQDNRYGAGNRVHNPLKVEGKNKTLRPQFRCTVCNTIK